MRTRAPPRLQVRVRGRLVGSVPAARVSPGPRGHRARQADGPGCRAHAPDRQATGSGTPRNLDRLGRSRLGLSEPIPRLNFLTTSGTGYRVGADCCGDGPTTWPRRWRPRDAYRRTRRATRFASSESTNGPRVPPPCKRATGVGDGVLLPPDPLAPDSMASPGGDRAIFFRIRWQNRGRFRIDPGEGPPGETRNLAPIPATGHR
jgi:hypothetical protein